MMTRLAALIVVIALSPAQAAAQDEPLVASSASRPLVRTDGTYVFNHVPNSNLVFEAQIAPRTIIADAMDRPASVVLAEGKAPVWGYQVSATRMVRLRMSTRNRARCVRRPTCPRASCRLFDSETFRRRTIPTKRRSIAAR